MEIKKALIVGLSLTLTLVICLYLAFSENRQYIRHVSSIMPNFNIVRKAFRIESKPLKNGGEGSLLMKGATGNLSHSQSETPCYRQVQVWDGSKLAQTPRKSQCPGLKCGISFVKDRSYVTMMKSDAVVFFHLSRWSWAEVLNRRPLNQAWVFYSLESPPLTGRNALPPRILDHIFNYTMSYRPSSTIPSPYGIYDDTLPQIPQDQNKNWAEGKTRLVAWASSKCFGHGGIQSWRRRNFVKTLSKHVSVDMYGQCGDQVCPRYSQGCWTQIKAHKFYLALENNECREYITEKFWVNALRNDIVPIVYGPPREDYERVAPPNSFIHLQDFRNMSELVDYINLLDANDTLYNQYFEWKKRGSVKFVGEYKILQAQFMCKVVSKLLDDENTLNGNYHAPRDANPSIHDYWSTSCPKPKGFPHDF
ncbi:alpha-(1,3)-fucosyltransferase 7-like [Lytechinus variegatus]|uniref:alpha-(1,3)-fucosyltransferase 7-like n=1 Tax=Lytechinus variegatus TaxID=7654 RepID=UPI001BB2908A|nr:alpha-(1,3)-fucosyltransferase 7-like [Lytechinus variegatus]